MRTLLVSSHDPAVNLALEESLMAMAGAEGGFCLLWRNNPSVIVGRHQCTDEVINAEFVNTNRLPVVRRMSGGGAVYHDLGNLNFSFITHVSNPLTYTCTPFLTSICNALAAVGVCAEPTGRNDLEVAGKKISGTSQVRLRDTVLFHGTLLVGVDIQRLENALRVDQAKIHSKGVASIAARVANVKDLVPCTTTTEELISAITEAILDQYGQGNWAIPERILVAADALAEKKYRQWNWNYGALPPSSCTRSRRFPWGEVSLRLQIREGAIASCAIRGDFFSLRNPQELEELLCGQPWNSVHLKALLQTVPWAEYFLKCDPKVMLGFFACAADEQGYSS